MGILQDAKRYMGYYYNESLGWLERPAVKYKGRELSGNAKETLGKVLKYLSESDFVTEETKGYLKSTESVMRVYAYSLYEEDKDKNPHTTMSKIGYDRKKMIKFLGDSFIQDILSGNIEPKAAENVLSTVVYRYNTHNDFRDAFVVSLPDNGKIVSDLSDEEFDMFISIIEPYTKRKYDTSMRYISDAMIGYFNFLSLGRGSTDKDEERLVQLRSLLFGRESKI